MIAQVVVDVAAKQTDRLFEYLIPESLGEINIGARVVVPFGARKVQGFIVGFAEKTAFKGKLKPLLLVVDELPPLTSELVTLSAFLAQRIFAYRISILKTMLPRVMRANYRKHLIPNNTQVGQLPFFKAGFVDLDDLTQLEQVAFAKKLLQNNQAHIDYLVENRAKVKTAAIYELTQNKVAYKEFYEHLRANATQQRQLLMYLVQNFETFPKSQRKIIQATGVTLATLKTAVDREWLKRKEVEIYRNPLLEVTSAKPKPITLNEDQQRALTPIAAAIREQRQQTFLLEGVTGSGKTEVYLHAIRLALKQKKTALMLVPEISLTPQMVRQVKAHFGDNVAVLHSSLSEGEKYDEWRRIRRSQAKVVVGARSAIFAPLQHIGLIVIDEEHESSYKQEDNPRYHARDVALWRSQFHHCPVILGSATPSLDSRARAQKNLYKLLLLPHRANQKTLPKVKLIDLKQVQFAGNQFDLSVELVAAIKHKMAQHQQIILMLNRRGFASFLLCRNCGYVMKCPNCDLSLTMHKDTQRMQCHYCGYTTAIPKRCPNCQSQQIRFLGTGTQKIEETLHTLIDDVRVLRMDVDTTRRKGSYKRILDAFGNGEADVLLGTQMIAKGLDFPNVTLVGVVNADTGLWVPDYNASERTFDLLTQVAGRAGRATKQGEVLIQTYNPEHYAIKLAQTQNYEHFYQHELAVRYQGNYPPFFYTVLISISAIKDQTAAKGAFAIKRQLMQTLHLPTIVLGPTPSAISRLKNQYYYQILIKYKKEPKLNGLLHQIQDSAQTAKKNGLNIYIDNEPQHIL